MTYPTKDEILGAFTRHPEIRPEMGYSILYDEQTGLPIRACAMGIITIDQIGLFDRDVTDAYQFMQSRYGEVVTEAITHGFDQRKKRDYLAEGRTDEAGQYLAERAYVEAMAASVALFGDLHSGGDA